MSVTGAYIPPVIDPTGSAVSAMASSQVSQLTAGVHLESDFERERRLHEAEKHNDKYTKIVSGIATAGMITALLAMYIEASFICLIAFFFPLVTAPYAINQRRQLNKFPYMEEAINNIRYCINQLSQENTKLTEETTKLESYVSTLKEKEETLESVVNRQGRNVTEFRALVKENGKIQQQMKLMQETHVIQQLFRAILTSDKDQDSQISQHEMSQLVRRLRNIKGISNNFDEERFRNAMASAGSHNSKSIATILAVTKDLLNEDELELGRVTSMFSQY
mmetsp:Transcript_9809/g.15076  ORF Transcript_9809/g.15076 Transcript_9809/m.15076 type:complete len:278 (-) Transcript_9809:248-1081(-)|eukprot:CAMPEP_0195295320 /NCGR_PEP_ID=MMETSP0707-20130614/17102_1 /TAXON_ID=33640 /ORGANISM="Asterionellopsis glacialis, Strain CCMP134" /LENGTH=277 /DNA_ID=CAMNT_0040356515 /DNA_START=64 /DNA_END=897 /DNA_ORIENTATION=+